MTIATHELPAAELLLLAAGGGSGQTLRRLCEAERSKHILLLHTVIAEAARRFPAAHRELELAASWGFLSRAQSHAPDAVADVLGMPQLGAWAIDCLRRLVRSESDNPALRADLAQTGAFAAVACLRAALDFDVPFLASPGGRPALPGFGVLPVAVHGGPRRLRCRGGRLELLTADAAVTVALPRPPTVTTRHAGLSLDVDIDCSTPSLDCHRHRRLESVGPEELRQWTERLAGAWRILTVHHRADAEAISVVVRTLVPLEPDGAGSNVAATLPSAFGAVAASLPSDDLVMAETLVHELQHLKLCSVLDLVPLVKTGTDSGGGGLSYAPWRDDPRPATALLHGTYAYLGVTRFWQTQRRLLPADQALRGHAEFVRRRAETLGAAEDLLASGQLTPEGERFVGGAVGELRAWGGVSVPAQARRLGLRASFEHRTTWEARHVAVDPEVIEELAARWAAGRPARLMDWPDVRFSVRPAERHGPHARGRLLTLRYADPRRFHRLLVSGESVGAGSLGLGPTDVALLRDDLATATAGYRDRLRRRPGGPEVWSGLALAVRDRPSDPAAAFLSRRVPLVSALHTALHAARGGTPDPLALAGWLACGTSGTSGTSGASGADIPGRYTFRAGESVGSTP